MSIEWNCNLALHKHVIYCKTTGWYLLALWRTSAFQRSEVSSIKWKHNKQTNVRRAPQCCTHSSKFLVLQCRSFEANSWKKAFFCWSVAWVTPRVSAVAYWTKWSNLKLGVEMVHDQRSVNVIGVSLQSSPPCRDTGTELPYPLCKGEQSFKALRWSARLVLQVK